MFGGYEPKVQLLKSRAWAILASSLAIVLGSSAHAEDGSDSSRNRIVGFGGPQSVENLIETDRTVRSRQPYQIEFLNPYFAWKDRLSEDYRLSFGSDYSSVGLTSNDNLEGSSDEVFGGLLRFFGSWNLFESTNGTRGSLVWRLGQHRSYSNTSPSEFGIDSLGYVGVMDPLHDDLGGKLNNLYWTQSWSNGAMLMFGYHDIADFADTYALTDPLKQFTNLAFLTGAGTMPVPSSGSLGAVGAFWLSDFIYLQGGLTDTNGDPTDPLEGFDTFFDDNEYFTHVELGWSTDRSRIYLDNIHLTLWTVDERDSLQTDDGWGAAFSFSYFIQDRYLPFLKAAYADDGTSLLGKSVSAGIGYQPSHSGADIGDLIGVGFNWGDPNSSTVGPGLKDQYTFEVFYRWQALRILALTFDVQYLKDPALNPDEDEAWVFGLRARLAM
jgi:porin